MAFVKVHLILVVMTTPTSGLLSVIVPPVIGGIPVEPPVPPVEPPLLGGGLTG